MWWLRSVLHLTRSEFCCFSELLLKLKPSKLCLLLRTAQLKVKEVLKRPDEAAQCSGSTSWAHGSYCSVTEQQTEPEQNCCWFCKTTPTVQGEGSDQGFAWTTSLSAESWIFPHAGVWWNRTFQNQQMKTETVRTRYGSNTSNRHEGNILPFSSNLTQTFQNTKNKLKNRSANQ